MNTREAIEKLPWLVNGSLDAAEAVAVRAQLVDSAECRAELAELAEAGHLFGTRIPVDTLLDYVAGRDIAPFARETIERFLNVSPTGSDEWRMATESWNGVQQLSTGENDNQSDNVLPFRRRAEQSERAARSWRSAAIAASLLAVLGVGGWWSTLRDSVPAGFNPTIVAVKAVKSDLVLRDASTASVPVAGSTLGPVQLSLVGSESGSKRTLEILDANGNVAWAPSQQFAADIYGHFIVVLPANLDPGLYTVQLYRGAGVEREAAELYSIEMR